MAERERPLDGLRMWSKIFSLIFRGDFQSYPRQKLKLLNWGEWDLDPNFFQIFQTTIRYGWGYQNGWILEKYQRGGDGGHFQSKYLCRRFWTFKQGFLAGVKYLRNSVSVTDPILKIKGSLSLSLTTHSDWKETVLNKISFYLSANNTSHDIASALFTSREFLKLTHKCYCPFQEEQW